MFSKHDHFLDLSLELREEQDWAPGVLRAFDIASKVTALAYEPIAGLLAVGTPGSIELLGQPGVSCKIPLPDLHGVKIIHISASTFKLVCLDDQSTLYIWDLSTYGLPKLLTSARYNQLSDHITISFAHLKAFITLQTGEIRTYDLECLRKSSYSMPNMWKLYEQKMAASGMPEVTTPTSGIAIDTLVHPRDLNLLFVVYGGGIVLCDLTQRNTIRTYELIYPPGAPGGAGYESKDILTTRRPEAMCMAIHPAGHFFAVGYADGSIAFWAVEDEDQPLLVRTLDDVDVQVIDALQLEAHLAEGSKSATPFEREPIFKLSWCFFPNSSDPRGGETALVILGGLGPGDSPGINVYWLPAFNPAEIPPTQPSSLHPLIKTSMRSSVEPLNSYFYGIDGTVQDYILIPRESPHFAGAYDPVSILVIKESIAGTRVIEAYQFPPPSFVYEDPLSAGSAQRDTLDDLTHTLQSLQLSNEPFRTQLPGYLSNGSSGLLGGTVCIVDKDEYSSLIQSTKDDNHGLPLNAGFAWLDPVEHFQPQRISITWYADLSVRMWDSSALLLHKFRPNPIDCEFPNPLSHLSIDVNAVLTAASVAPKMQDQNPTIQFVEMASESLECAVVLSTGMVVVYQLSSSPNHLPPSEELPDPELLSLKHLASMDSKFSLYVALSPSTSKVSACALADIGFLAVSYTDGSLYVVDMRGPKVILRVTKPKSRHSIHMGSDIDIVSSLLWTISPLEKDERLALRLIAGHSSGTLKVFTFGRSVDSSWNLTGEPMKSDSPVQPLQIFVIDSKRGSRCTANRSKLLACMDNSGASPVLLVIAGIKGARCNVNLTGERVGKVEWSHRMGKVLNVQIVQKLSSYALVAFTENHEACAYSLPNLEFMQNLALPPLSYMPVACDEVGDFFAWTRDPETGLIRQVTYGTLFNSRRVDMLPAIDFLSTKPVIPIQPQPVSLGPTSMISSWFRFGQSMTGTQIDTLLGGPDRPVPVQQARPTPATGGSGRDASHIVKQAAATQSSLYDRLTSALEERGEMLGDLEDRFNSLESGSRSMVDQAKKLAAEQSAKSWFKFGS
ncbi:WD40 containing snare-dependent exocytosis protein [Rhodocollybia butyracea]|uniref:WD40 containing snare-dependent exocytosis protein n=1 Tax=Rhodocollybia butyracea TaxID=206335 RepID=A0A9P5UD87_9AGAR|nr:WD40 containing snare-dependent exocytosis protein [Rhodocollybia butyracea]